MDFLKDFALPQPFEHYQLLLVMLGLIGVVLVPYVGFLLGTGFLSLRYRKRGEAERNPLYTRLAKDLIDLAVHDPKTMAFLGLIPALSMLFFYAQLMQSTAAYTVDAAGYFFFLLLIGGILLSVYRRAFDLTSILKSHLDLLTAHKGSRAELAEIDDMGHGAERRAAVSGRYGVIAVGVAAYFLVASFTVTADPSLWESVRSWLDLLLCAEVFLKFLQFLALAAGITGSGILFFFVAWSGTRIRENDEYIALVRRIGMRLTVGSVIVQPLFMIISILILPSTVLSGLLFGSAGLVLFFLFLTVQYIYAHFKEAKPKYASYAFISVIIATGLLVTNEQIAISNATKSHAIVLALRSEQATEELKSQLGISLVTVTGADIFNGKCSACHNPDTRKVGPPFRVVLKKYEGKRDQLVSFIRNPSKVDPAYPPMPNQGLKPAEADSIADFILRNFLTPQSTDAKPSPEGS